MAVKNAPNSSEQHCQGGYSYSNIGPTAGELAGRLCGRLVGLGGGLDLFRNLKAVCLNLLGRSAGFLFHRGEAEFMIAAALL